MTLALLLVGLVNAHPFCAVVSGRGGYSLSSRALLLSIYLQLTILQRFYERLGSVSSPFDAVQHAGVVEVIRRFPDHWKAHVGTHHASDGPTQVPNIHKLLRPSASE